MKRTLKEFRAKYNYTQQEMADKLGVSIQTYNSWEKNIANVKMANIQKLAIIFGVTLDDFLFTNEHENISCQD